MVIFHYFYYKILNKKLSGKTCNWTLTTNYYLKTTLLKKIRVWLKGYLSLVSRQLLWYFEIFEIYDWNCFEIRDFCPGKKFEKKYSEIEFVIKIFWIINTWICSFQIAVYSWQFMGNSHICHRMLKEHSRSSQKNNWKNLKKIFQDVFTYWTIIYLTITKI